MGVNQKLIDAGVFCGAAALSFLGPIFLAQYADIGEVATSVSYGEGPSEKCAGKLCIFHYSLAPRISMLVDFSTGVDGIVYLGALVAIFLCLCRMKARMVLITFVAGWTIGIIFLIVLFRWHFFNDTPITMTKRLGRPVE